MLKIFMGGAKRKGHLTSDRKEKREEKAMDGIKSQTPWPERLESYQLEKVLVSGEYF